MPAPIEAYLFALLAAIAWGLAPVVLKRGLEHGGSTLLGTTIAIATNFTVFFLIATVAYGPGETYLALDPYATAIFLCSGVVGSAIGRLVMYVGIDRVGASVNTAVVSTRPLFAALLAIFLLGEPFSGWLGAGIVMITLGVGILSLSRGGDVRGWSWYELLFPLLTAVSYAAGNVLRRYGFTTSDSGVLGAMVVNEFAALSLVGGYVLATRGSKFVSISRHAYAYFFVGGFLDGMGVLLLFAALSVGPVVVVDPLTAAAPLFAVVFTVLLLKRVEAVTRGVVFGALVVVTGVVFVTVG